MNSNMTYSEFITYIKFWYKRWFRVSDKSIYLHCVSDHKTFTRITNVKTGKSALVKCGKFDKFNNIIGTALAFAEYCGTPLPLKVDGMRFYNGLKEVAGDETFFITDNVIDDVRYSLNSVIPY
jgi:hypothetical protein